MKKSVHGERQPAWRRSTITQGQKLKYSEGEFARTKFLLVSFTLGFIFGIILLTRRGTFVIAVIAF